MELCSPVYKFDRKASPVIDSLNEILPIKNDVELIQGGLINEAMIHEMLMHTKKTLAVSRYCEMAARLVVPGSFPIWYLYGVPIAFAGKCSSDGPLYRTKKLVGSVMIQPVAWFRAKPE
jgi:hypothetical protein